MEATAVHIDPATNKEHFDAVEGLPFDLMKWLTTIRAHAMALRDGDSDVQDITACITINVCELAKAIREKETR